MSLKPIQSASPAQPNSLTEDPLLAMIESTLAFSSLGQRDVTIVADANVASSAYARALRPSPVSFDWASVVVDEPENLEPENPIEITDLIEEEFESFAPDHLVAWKIDDVPRFENLLPEGFEVSDTHDVYTPPTFSEFKSFGKAPSRKLREILSFSKKPKAFDRKLYTPDKSKFQENWNLLVDFVDHSKAPTNAMFKSFWYILKIACASRPEAREIRESFMREYFSARLQMQRHIRVTGLENEEADIIASIATSRGAEGSDIMKRPAQKTPSRISDEERNRSRQKALASGKKVIVNPLLVTPWTKKPSSVLLQAHRRTCLYLYVFKAYYGNKVLDVYSYLPWGISLNALRFRIPASVTGDKDEFFYTDGRPEVTGPDTMPNDTAKRPPIPLYTLEAFNGYEKKLEWKQFIIDSVGQRQHLDYIPSLPKKFKEDGSYIWYRRFHRPCRLTPTAESIKFGLEYEATIAKFVSRQGTHHFDCFSQKELLKTLFPEAGVTRALNLALTNGAAEFKVTLNPLRDIEARVCRVAPQGAFFGCMRRHPSHPFQDTWDTALEGFPLLYDSTQRRFIHLNYERAISVVDNNGTSEVRCVYKPNLALMASPFRQFEVQANIHQGSVMCFIPSTEFKPLQPIHVTNSVALAHEVEDLVKPFNSMLDHVELDRLRQVLTRDLKRRMNEAYPRLSNLTYHLSRFQEAYSSIFRPNMISFMQRTNLTAISLAGDVWDNVRWRFYQFTDSTTFLPSVVGLGALAVLYYVNPARILSDSLKQAVDDTRSAYSDFLIGLSPRIANVFNTVGFWTNITPASLFPGFEVRPPMVETRDALQYEATSLLAERVINSFVSYLPKMISLTILEELILQCLRPQARILFGMWELWYRNRNSLVWNAGTLPAFGAHLIMARYYQEYPIFVLGFHVLFNAFVAQSPITNALSIFHLPLVAIAAALLLLSFIPRPPDVDPLPLIPLNPSVSDTPIYRFDALLAVPPRRSEPIVAQRLTSAFIQEHLGREVYNSMALTLPWKGNVPRNKINCPEESGYILETKFTPEFLQNEDNLRSLRSVRSDSMLVYGGNRNMIPFHFNSNPVNVLGGIVKRVFRERLEPIILAELPQEGQIRIPPEALEVITEVNRQFNFATSLDRWLTSRNDKQRSKYRRFNDYTAAQIALEATTSPFKCEIFIKQEATLNMSIRTIFQVSPLLEMMTSPIVAEYESLMIRVMKGHAVNGTGNVLLVGGLSSVEKGSWYVSRMSTGVTLCADVSAWDTNIDGALLDRIRMHYAPALAPYFAKASNPEYYHASFPGCVVKAGKDSRGQLSGSADTYFCNSLVNWMIWNYVDHVLGITSVKMFCGDDSLINLPRMSMAEVERLLPRINNIFSNLGLPVKLSAFPARDPRIDFCSGTFLGRVWVPFPHKVLSKIFTVKTHDRDDVANAQERAAYALYHMYKYCPTLLNKIFEGKRRLRDVVSDPLYEPVLDDSYSFYLKYGTEDEVFAQAGQVERGRIQDEADRVLDTIYPNIRGIPMFEARSWWFTHAASVMFSAHPLYPDPVRKYREAIAPIDPSFFKTGQNIEETGAFIMPFASCMLMQVAIEEESGAYVDLRRAVERNPHQIVEQVSGDVMVRILDHYNHNVQAPDIIIRNTLSANNVPLAFTELTSHYGTVLRKVFMYKPVGEKFEKLRVARQAFLAAPARPRVAPLAQPRNPPAAVQPPAAPVVAANPPQPRPVAANPPQPQPGPANPGPRPNPQGPRPNPAAANPRPGPRPAANPQAPAAAANPAVAPGPVAAVNPAAPAPNPAPAPVAAAAAAAAPPRKKGVVVVRRRR